MEFIILILVCIFFAVSGAGKKNRTAARQRTPNGDPRAAGQPVRGAAAAGQKPAEAPVMPGNAQTTFDASLTELRQRLNVAGVAPAEGQSILDDEDCHGGSMPHAHTEGLSDLEDEECVGGSMVHTHTEGVSRTAQARRMAAMDGSSDESPRARSGLAPGSVDAQALRRAVVMAEVLGKPKALKRSRFVA